MASVKTYRVLHDGLRVGDSVRNFGDPIPEAAEFANLRSYLRAEYIEEVFMDEEDLEKQMQEIRERNKAEPEEEVETDDQAPETVNDDPEPQPKEKPKTTAKKVAAKSKTKKRTVKKKKDEGNERRLTEHSV